MWLSLLGQMGHISKMRENSPPSSSMLDFEVLDLVKSSSLFILCHPMLLHRGNIHLAYLFQVLYRSKQVTHVDLSIFKNLHDCDKVSQKV